MLSKWASEFLQANSLTPAAFCLMDGEEEVFLCVKAEVDYERLRPEYFRYVGMSVAKVAGTLVQTLKAHV